jgi:hypothetical protein
VSQDLGGYEDYLYIIISRQDKRYKKLKIPMCISQAKNSNVKETQGLLSLAPTFKDAGSIEDASTRAGVEIELTKNLGIRSRIQR